MRYLYLLLLMIVSLKVSAQTNAANHEYYLVIEQLNSHEKILRVKQLLENKPGVVYLMANRCPARYIVMRTTRSISTSEIRNWLPNQQIAFIGEGKKAREEALTFFNRSNVRTR